jgi:glycosyltransferase involved in cell wall biosynthesis
MPRSTPHILFVVHDSGRTGATIGLLAFVRWLRANTGYGIGVLLRAPGPLEASFRELGPTTTLGNSFLAHSRLGRRIRRWLPRAWREETQKIKRAFSGGPYDLVYSSTITNGSVLEVLAPFGAPILTHVHELEYWIERMGEDNLRRVRANTLAYIAPAHAVRANLIDRHGIPGERITVVYEHIRELPPVPADGEKTAARKTLGLPPGAVVIGGCGVEHWRKGRDLIPQLLLALRRRRPGVDFHFLWVGRFGTPEEEAGLRIDLRNSGLEDRCHSSGEVQNPFALFPAMSAFALLSRDDPYPLACLEVAALEIPVVCFAGAGGMPEFAEGGCALVAPYLDLETMASHLIQLEEDPELARACGRRAREKVARENLLATTAPQLKAIIDRLIASPENRA